MALGRRLIFLFSILIFFCAVLPPELVSFSAQDQNIEIENDSAEKEIDDNDEIDLKFFSPTPGTSASRLISFAKINHATIASLLSEEVPSPPPLCL
jgi:hypothetical protein